MDFIFWIFITLFLLTLFGKLSPKIEWLKYEYDLNNFFLLIKNIHEYFDNDGKIPHGTIRLTKDVITVVVTDPKTHESSIYDVHYNKQTMEIVDVQQTNMSFALEAEKRHTHIN